MHSAFLRVSDKKSFNAVVLSLFFFFFFLPSFVPLFYPLQVDSSIAVKGFFFCGSLDQINRQVSDQMAVNFSSDVHNCESDLSLKYSHNNSAPSVQQFRHRKRMIQMMKSKSTYLSLSD